MMKRNSVHFLSPLFSEKRERAVMPRKNARSSVSSHLIITYQGYTFMLCINFVFIEFAIPNLSLEYVFVYHKSIIKPVIKTDFEHKIPFWISVCILWYFTNIILLSKNWYEILVLMLSGIQFYIIIMLFRLVWWFMIENFT